MGGTAEFVSGCTARWVNPNEATYLQVIKVPNALNSLPEDA